MWNKTPISKTTSRTSTHHSNYTLREGVAETLEDEVAEEDLVGEEVQSQCVTEIKEIKQALAGTVWDFYHRFKTLMDMVSFQMSDVQHKEWFIATLLPHIWGPLMQQKMELQT